MSRNLRHTIVALVVCFSAPYFAAPCFASGAERDDTDSLERLRVEIEHRLPADWSVSVDPARSEPGNRDSESPAILIRSRDKIRVKTQYPGAAPGQPPLEESERIEIVLSVQPFKTPSDYEKARGKNEQLVALRTKMEQRLRSTSWAYKGAAPIPPSAFRPKDERERRLVLEYALLWNRTCPEPLPTHYFEHLSFDVMRPLDDSSIVDQAKATQYNDIIKSLDGMLTSYSKKDE